MTTSGAFRFCAVELPARFGSPGAQTALAAELVGATRPDLVLLPEAALTGYVSEDLACDLSAFAEPLAVGAARLTALARRCGADVVGPVVEAHRGRLYNALVGVTPSGQRWLHYRKRHPWYPETWATPGGGPHPLVPWRGLALTCALCFDVHFLAAEAAGVLGVADALLFPSAWVDGGETRGPLLEELAETFGVTVLNANWGVGRPALHGQGGSMAVWPDGRVRTLRAPERTLTISLSPRRRRGQEVGAAPL